MQTWWISPYFYAVESNDKIGVNGPLNPFSNKMIPTQELWCVNASEKRFSFLGSIAAQRFAEIGEFG